jgi:hypothetical protein
MDPTVASQPACALAKETADVAAGSGHELTIPAGARVQQFWWVTLCDDDTRASIVNDTGGPAFDSRIGRVSTAGAPAPACRLRWFYSGMT